MSADSAPTSPSAERAAKAPRLGDGRAERHPAGAADGDGAARLPLPKGGVDIDGSQLEGGGQIVRIAASLSVVLGIPVRIGAIRAGRPGKPGLRPQHCAALRATCEVGGARLRGCEVGSSEVTIEPRLRGSADGPPALVEGPGGLMATPKAPPRADEAQGAAVPPPSDERRGEAAGPPPGCPGEAPGRPRPGPDAAAGPAPSPRAVVADAGTAGSVTLIAQAALPALVLSGGPRVALFLRGGTDVPFAPGSRYLSETLLPSLARFGVKAEFRVAKHGFAPRGGGEAELTVAPLPRGAALDAISLERRGRLERVHVVARGGGRVPAAVPPRLVAAAIAGLRAPADAEGAEVGGDGASLPPREASGDGCFVSCEAATDSGCLFAASALGERRERAEDVGAAAARELAEALGSGACVDAHLADQLVVFMALARGRSRVSVPWPPSLHLETAIAVCERLTAARFSFESAAGGDKSRLLSCDGIGWPAAAAGGGDPHGAAGAAGL